MHAPTELPEPDATALEHSEKLAALIRERIAAADGWIDFAAYMDLALYAPGLGYYSAGAAKFGAAGDFMTAPEISALFAGCVARAIEPIVARGSDQVILELGAGTGLLAAGVLSSLARVGTLPARYLILEVSADLRDRQRRTLSERAPDLLALVDWLDEPPSGFDGVVLANEVADALAVARFRIDAGEDRVRELGVMAAEDGFRWAERAAPESLRERVGALEASIGEPFAAPFTSEVSMSLPAFVGELGRVMRDGLCLLIDYGLPRRELYAPGRSDGTLICHYRHRAHADPFLYPGLQDISAWVDFTALAEAAAAAGLRVDSFMTQAGFLLAAGIEDEFLAAGADSRDPRSRVSLSREMQTLMMPGEMGEKFKVICLGKGNATLAPPFELHDHRHRL